VADAAAALVAVGALSEALAETVIDDYAAVMALRGNGPQRRPPPGGQTGPPQAGSPLSLPRLAACFRELELPTGTLQLRYASFEERATTLGITFRDATRRRQRRGPPQRMTPGSGHGPPNVTLSDDRGYSSLAHFAGGGSDTDWTGHLRTVQPLAADTAWIELDGTRVELDDSTVSASVTVEERAGEDPAVRHLWQRLAAAHHFRPAGANLEEAITALVAAGALAEDAPALEDVRAVAAALQHGRSPGGGPGALPQPWRSLLARQGSSDGPSGKLLVGVATPLFDGISVAVLMLESGEGGFEIEVQTKPPIEPGHMPGRDPRTRRLAWWAADDRGNHYLGGGGRWSWDEGHAEGSVEFWPALDPSATRLEIRPTSERARAVIDVPLAWARQGEEGEA
jgi:hypothetical protein